MSRRPPKYLSHTAISGVGYTTITRASGRSVLELAAEAVAAAVSDCGLQLQDLDGVLSYQYQGDSAPSAAVATSLGLTGCRALYDISLGGQAPCALVALAAALVDAGEANYIAVYRAMNGRSGARVGQVRTESAASRYRYPIGLVAYPQTVALWARRFMIETGATTEDLAAVPIAQRAWAANNERAVIRDQLTIDQYFDSPMVTDPFRMVDCTIEVDGAAAVIVTTLDRARDLALSPVVIASSAYRAAQAPGLDMADATHWKDLSRNYTSHLSKDLFGWSGLSVADIDVAELYDCFSSSVLFALEGLGFAERGASGALLRSGATLPGGQLPVNTHGGLLCEGYLHGMNSLTEAVLQLQARAGANQVPKAETAIVTSGALMDGSALILTK